MFRTLTNRGNFVRRKRHFPKFQPTYCYDVDKDTGKKVVVQNGKTNVFQQKQEALPMTQVYNLIDRIERTGDMSLLGEAVEGYFDATFLPRDMMEAKVIQCRVENLYRNLPIEEKKKYDNDISVFYKKVNEKLHENAKKAAEAARAADIAQEGGTPNE